MKLKDLTTPWRFLFLIFFITYGIASYWLFWPYVPMTIEDPIKILNDNKQVVPGGRLVYEMKIDKKLPLPAMISKQLINHYVITYSQIIGNVPLGKRTMKVSIRIPPYASGGKYKLKWEGVYKVNPIREVSVIEYSEEFTILGKCVEE